MMSIRLCLAIEFGAGRQTHGIIRLLQSSNQFDWIFFSIIWTEGGCSVGAAWIQSGSREDGRGGKYYCNQLATRKSLGGAIPHRWKIPT